MLCHVRKRSGSFTYKCETGISGPLFVIVEFAPHGNLRQFLRERRPSEYQPSRQSYSGPSLTMRDFVSFAFQIARGMEYLGTKKVQYLGNHSIPNQDQRSIYAKAATTFAENKIKFYGRIQNTILNLAFRNR